MENCHIVAWMDIPKFDEEECLKKLENSTDPADVEEKKKNRS